MLLPRVLKIQDDELLYGWYERILQENRIEGNKGEETRFFRTFFNPREDAEIRGTIRYDYILNLERLCTLFTGSSQAWRNFLGSIRIITPCCRCGRLGSR